MTTADIRLPIFEQTVAALKAGLLLSARPEGSACTPGEWFGPPVHGRGQDATQVMQAVTDEPERRAS